MAIESPGQNELQSKEVSRSRQIAFSFIDVGICFFIFLMVLLYKKPYFLYEWSGRTSPVVILVLFIILYRLCSFLIFGRTIGMKLLRVEILNGEGNELSVLEKLLASFLILYKGAGYYHI